MARDIFRHEWRLFIRNRAVAVIAVLYAIALPVLSADLMKSGPARLFAQWQLFNIFIVLPMLFLGAQLAQRDETARFAEVFSSLPVSNGALLSGRLAVGGIVVAVAAIAQAVTGAVAAVIQRVPLVLYLRGWAAVWPTTFLILACAMLAGYTIALVVGRRAGLLVIGAYWLVPLFTTAFLGSVSAMAHTLRIFDMSGAWGIIPTDMWGVGPERGLRTYRMIFLIAFASLCLVVSLLTHERRRPTGLARPRMAVVSLALTAALVLSVAGYGGIYHTRVTQSEARDPGPETDTLSPFAVSDYDLNVTLRGAQLATQASLAIRNGGTLPESAMLLTLRDSLAVSQADWDGKPVEVQRAGNYLTIDLPEAVQPGESGLLRLNYAGPVADWEIAERTNNDVNLRFGVGKGYAYLPYPAAWYPVPGHLRCAPPGRPRTGMQPHAPARFSLSVDGGGLAVISNLPAAGGGRFEGHNYSGVYLLAAPRLSEVTGDGYRFVHYTGPAKSVKRTMDTVCGLVHDASAFLPIEAPARVELLALPAPFASTEIPAAPPGPDGTLTLAVAETWAGITDVHPRAALDDSLLARTAAWTLSPGFGMDDNEITGSIGMWLSLRLGAESLGQSYDDAMQVFASEVGQPTPGGLIAALDARLRAGGAEAVRDALRPLTESPEMDLQTLLKTLQPGVAR